MHRALLTIFALTTFLSAALLFAVQPMVAKMVLPLLGGSPAVWNACMVFFQAGLLAGYAYSHFLTMRLRPAAQVAVHAAVLALSTLLLPVGLRSASPPPAQGSPTLWLLWTLALSVGIPFFVLSTTGPLIQRWLAQTDHPDAADPYFLYAASNLGSLGSLLAYPLLLEPFLRLRAPEPSSFLARWGTQSGLWSSGYLLFAAFAVACGGCLLRRLAPTPRDRSAADPPIPWRTRLRWIALAVAPSSAMLGVTQYLTTDIAAVPLLWVLPLALYLLTYVVAFSRRGVGSSWPSAALAVLALAVAASWWLPVRQPLWLAFPLHLLTLVAAGLACHGQLATERPAAGRLTEFYFLVALGGVLGGAFNALVAPEVFFGIAEYPIALVLACLLRPGRAGRREVGGMSRLLDLALPAGIALASVGTRFAVDKVGLAGSPAALVFQIAFPALLCIGLVDRPPRFAAGLAVLFGLAGPQDSAPQVLHRERTFFGIHRVTRQLGRTAPSRGAEGTVATAARPFHVLFHGSTHHGAQAWEPELHGNPTSYFHRSGPIGDVFAMLQGAEKLRDVAIVGLGAGTLAAYGLPGQRFTFYEIDPAVVRIANDPRFFTYLSDSTADVRCVVGDGRLGLASADDAAYDLIVIDAFSSDSVPVHLLTREAVATYLQKLRPEGVLALQLSNVFLDLERCVRALAAELKLAGAVKLDSIGTPRELLEGKDPSRWAALARQPDVLAPLLRDPQWVAFPDAGDRSARSKFLWTDDYSNVVAILRFR